MSFWRICTMSTPPAKAAWKSSRDRPACPGRPCTGRARQGGGAPPGPSASHEATIVVSPRLTRWVIMSAEDEAPIAITPRLIGRRRQVAATLGVLARRESAPQSPMHAPERRQPQKNSGGTTLVPASESGIYLRRPGGTSLRSPRSTWDPVSLPRRPLRCIHLDGGPVHRIPGAGH